jgi:hypothetical protein
MPIFPENLQKLPKIAQKLPKNCQTIAKICQKLAKSAENSDHNIDLRPLSKNVAASLGTFRLLLTRDQFYKTPVRPKTLTLKLRTNFHAKNNR